MCSRMRKAACCRIGTFQPPASFRRVGQGGRAWKVSSEEVTAIDQKPAQLILEGNRGGGKKRKSSRSLIGSKPAAVD